MDLASSTRAAEDRTRWKGVDVKLSPVPKIPKLGGSLLLTIQTINEFNTQLLPYNSISRLTSNSFSYKSFVIFQSPVVQSIISLMSSLRGH